MNNLVDSNDRFVGSYWQWLKVQLSGWDTLPWSLFGFAVGIQGMSFALNPITWTSVVSFIATLFGSLCTVAMCAKGYDPITGKRVTSRSINGLLGAVSVVGFVIVNASMGHWFSVIDQLIFFFLIDVEQGGIYQTDRCVSASADKKHVVTCRLYRSEARRTGFTCMGGHRPESRNDGNKEKSYPYERVYPP